MSLGDLIQRFVDQNKVDLLNDVMKSIKVDKQKPEILLEYVKMTEHLHDKLPYRRAFIHKIEISFIERGLNFAELYQPEAA